MSRQLSITLPSYLAEQLEQRVASGAYADRSEVISNGLRELFAREEAVDAWKLIQRVVLKAWSESAAVMVCSNVCRGGGSRCGWILQDLMWAMVRSFGLADPVDALVGFLRGLAQFVVGEQRDRKSVV